MLGINGREAGDGGARPPLIDTIGAAGPVYSVGSTGCAVVSSTWRALDNAAMSLEVLGLSGQERTTRALEALALVGIEHHAKQRVAELCTGEQQRVAIARALAPQPAILLCDEPTGSVDPACAENLLHLFDRLNREQTTLVIATHSPEVVRFARAAGWRAAELRQGELMETVANEATPLLPLGSPFRAARLDEETEGFADRRDSEATDLIRLPSGRGRSG